MTPYEQAKTELIDRYIRGLHGTGERAAAEAASIMLDRLDPHDIDGTWEDVARQIAEATRRYREGLVYVAEEMVRQADVLDGVATDGSLIETAVEHILASRAHPLGKDRGRYLLQIRPKLLARQGVAAKDVVRDATARVAAQQLSATLDTPNELMRVLARGRGERWARRAFPSCCAFCAMLATREAEYRSQAAASVQVHDGCRCVAVPASMLRGVHDPITEAAKAAYRDAKSTKMADIRKAWADKAKELGIEPEGSRSARNRATWSESRMAAYREQQRQRMALARSKKRDAKQRARARQ